MGWKPLSPSRPGCLPRPQLRTPALGCSGCESPQQAVCPSPRLVLSQFCAVPKVCKWLQIMRPWALQRSGAGGEWGKGDRGLHGQHLRPLPCRSRESSPPALFLVKTAKDPATSRDSGAALNGPLQSCVKGALSTGLIVQGLLCLFLKVASFLYCRTYFCKIRMIWLQAWGHFSLLPSWFSTGARRDLPGGD